MGQLTSAATADLVPARGSPPAGRAAMAVADLVVAAQGGDLDAFGALVGRFQDLAYACAYAVLGDFHLAQDVAQEAFVEAYFDLPKLRETAAFPGWFRKIVFKRGDRLTRGQRVRTVPIEQAFGFPTVPTASGDPETAAMAHETSDA
ncbi:MAG: RNA polymerase sigma factor, partial [Chloroflexota bacterium]